MPSKVAIIVLVLGVAALAAPWAARAAAHSAPRERPRHQPELPGEQPDDDGPPISYADEWPASYVPNLIDIPAAELIERGHPTLEMTYVNRRIAHPAFTNLNVATLEGARLALHVRAFRDLQVSLQAPFYDARTTVLTPTSPAVPSEREISGVSAEAKYLVPYEVAGFRSAVGFRFLFSDDNERFLFLPDDFQRFSMAYAVVSRTPAPFLRMHLMYGAVFPPGLNGLPQGNHSLVAFGLEHQVFRLEGNWVRLIAEVASEHFPDPEQGPYGHITHAKSVYSNAAVRVRSGILQAELGLRRLGQPGFDELYAEVVKRF